MDLQLNTTQKAVLSLLKSALFGSEALLPDSLNWREVFVECQRQTVAALAFSSVPKGALTDDQYNKWKRLSKMVIANNLQVSFDHTSLHQLLSENGIPYVILKGCASAAYYPEPSLRMMGDVDFLVYKDNIEAVTALLCKNGFEYDKAFNPYERAFSKEESVWELHWDVNGAPGGRAGKIIHQYVLKMIDNAEKTKTPEGCYMIPCAFDHGLVMLLHCSIHLLNGGIGLRHLCDWAVFVEQFSDEEFSNLFEKRLKAAGLWRFAQILTATCSEFLGASEKEWAKAENKEMLLELILDIFEAGNFGKKDETRMDEAKFITNKSKGVIDNAAPVRQLMESSFDIVKAHWGAAEKHPVLLPIGTAYFGGRYLIRSIIGKRRRLNPRQLAIKANERKELYRNLKLFEVE